MKPDEIKALRKELRCTPRELAEALGVSAKTIMAWEAESMFPTRQYIDQMEELRAIGNGAVPRLRRGGASNPPPLQLLADPELWRLIRKLIAHRELREQAMKLAASYDEPE